MIRELYGNLLGLYSVFNSLMTQLIGQLFFHVFGLYCWYTVIYMEQNNIHDHNLLPQLQYRSVNPLLQFLRPNSNLLA